MKTTLLCGNVSYFNTAQLHTVFGNERAVLMARDIETKKEGNLLWFQSALMGEAFCRRFFLYDFSTVLYISRTLTFGDEAEEELSELRHLLELCRGGRVKRFVFLTGDHISAAAQNAKTIFQKAAEDLCHAYTNSNQIKLCIVRCPYFISGTNPHDWLYQSFQTLEQQKKLQIPVNPAEIASWIDIDDLSQFLYRLLDDEEVRAEELSLESYGSESFEQLAARLERLFPHTTVELDFHRPVLYPERRYLHDELERHPEKRMENKVRSLYGWYAIKNCAEELEQYAEDFRKTSFRTPRRWSIFRQRVHMKTQLWRYAELFLGALLVEFLNHLVQNNAQFRMVDLRLLFVVLMASTYGTRIGLIAALLEVLSLGNAYVREGRGWTQLFYDPSNWLPFILLFLVSAVCGYLHEQHQDTEAELQDEAQKYQSEAQFVTELYQQAQTYKNEYKQSLVESRDGFGRIFEMVEHLSHTIPERIYSEAIRVAEDVLNNQSIAIYSISQKDARFARLEVCSAALSGLDRSIELDAYRPFYPVMDREEVWVNRKLESGYPMLLTGIKQQGEYTLLIMIYDADYSQMTNYYINLVRILRRLTEQFLSRAYLYQQAKRHETYVGDTILTHPDYLLQQERIRKDMLERKIGTYSILHLHRGKHSLEDISALLERSMRTTDIAGLGMDGDVYIIAAQSDAETAPIVAERYRKLGFQAEIIEHLPGGEG